MKGKLLLLKNDERPKVLEEDFPLKYERLKELMEQKTLDVTVLISGAERSLVMYCDDEALLTKTPVNPWATLLRIRCTNRWDATNISGTCVVTCTQKGDDIPIPEDTLAGLFVCFDPEPPHMEVYRFG